MTNHKKSACEKALSGGERLELWNFHNHFDLIKKMMVDREFVSTNSLRKGTYIAKLITDTGMVEKKLVKA